MGGKNTTSTSQVTIPPEVLAQYNAVNARAQQAANTPFQTYSGQFVAPVNSTEQAGINQTSAAANAAQPYFNAATGQLTYAQNATTPYYNAAGTAFSNAAATGNSLAGASLSSLLSGQGAAAPLQASAASGINNAYAGAQPYQGASTALALAGGQAVDPSALNSGAILQYLSPYLGTVLGSTSALINQNNQQQQAGQLGNAITSGAFGGDRAGIAAANLEQQQNLANANIYSNIANEGYNNALSTAQQQQGLGLSAAQANRAALQTAAGQLQGIGQQGFEQGLGAATAQQGLAQQEYGQGATTAAQEAALGQQQFGQGLAAGQAQQGLGSAIYQTGANTASALGDLGSAAQSAALQGAQAQLQAGEVAQQTQQAQDTAAYNQFLQQQSYPFQVDQFLANIAEGTGALSGSTTTTTQPGGFFSDERLKEDIEPIGETFDGQKIVKFRYKGDPRMQIGLIAQDVEKKHPDAVGESQGYRTVDYDKATEKSAKRGKFAFGGQPTLPGMSQYDLASLLEAQQQMYAPYGQGGLYGASAAAAPRGGMGYVPQATLPVSHLAVAQPPQRAQTDPLQQIKEVADLSGEAQKGLGKLSGLFNSGDSDAANDAANDDGLPYARGGLARARMRRYAVGGAPMDDQDDDAPEQPSGPGLNIPDVSPHAKLAVAQPPKPQNGGGLGDIASILASMFNRGGRAGFDAGGAPIEDRGDPLSFLPNPANWPQDIAQALGGIGQMLSHSRDISRQTGYDPTNMSDEGAAASLPSAPPPTVGTPLGNIKSAPPPPIQHTRSALGSARMPAPANDQDAALQTDPLTMAPPTQTAMGLGLAAPQALDLDTAAPPQPDPGTQPHNPGLLQNIEGALGAVGHGFADRVKNDPNFLPAVLSGVAAMGLYPTRNLGVALAAGLQGGTQGYMERQNQLAKVGLTQGETGVQNAIGQRELAPPALPGMVAKWGHNPTPDGQTLTLANGQEYYYVPAYQATSWGQGAQAGTPANYHYLMSNGQEAAIGAPMSYSVASPTDREHSAARQEQVVSDAAAARAQLPNLHQYADSIGTDARGMLQPGPLSQLKAQWVGTYNDLMRTAGLSNLQINPAGLADKEITDKMVNNLALAQAQGADQHSLGAMQALVHSVPNNTMSPKAAFDMMGQRFVLNQMAIDKADYYQEMGQAVQARGGLPKGFLSRDADQAFGQDFTADRYDREAQLLSNAIANGSWAKAEAVMRSGNAEAKARITQLLNQQSPGLARYLTGGQ